MNNKILKWSLIGMLTLGSSLGFGQGREKDATTNADSVVTELDVHQARVDSAADYRKFKAVTELKIKENQKNINLLKNQKAVFTKETKERYDKKIVTLQEKNTTLQNRIVISGQTATDEWTTFKRNMNMDLQALSLDIKTVAADYTF